MIDVDFEVVDGFGRWAAVEGHDRGGRAVGIAECFPRLQGFGGDKGVAVFAPDWVSVGHAEGFGFGGDFNIEDVGREVFHCGKTKGSGVVDLEIRAETLIQRVLTPLISTPHHAHGSS